MVQYVWNTYIFVFFCVPCGGHSNKLKIWFGAKKYEKASKATVATRELKKRVPLLFVWLNFWNDERMKDYTFVDLCLNIRARACLCVCVGTFVCFVKFWSLTEMVRFKWIVNWLIVYWPYSRNTINATEKMHTCTHINT